MAYPQGKPILNATRARQGRFGRNVFWVLIAGILLTVLGFAATWAWKAGDFASTEPNNARQASDVTGFKSPPPHEATRQNYQEGGPLAPKGGNPPSGSRP